jgi:thiamine biosynthesis lipoprotein
MGTFVTIHVVSDEADAALDSAFAWFHRIERVCSRFDPASELTGLTRRAGDSVRVSTILYEAVQFALRVAEETDGAFDPTVGGRMEANGFDRDHRTGARVESAIDRDARVSYRDVHLDRERQTIRLQRPLVLDLGAVAKGLAVDMAARELRGCRDFAIDAGGDLYLSGCNPEGMPWAVGIRHPREEGLLDTLRVTDAAVCTSGDYERHGRAASTHHILDPRTGESAAVAASATVIAPTAMVADALATAAFVLGPEHGIRLLARLGVEGLIVTPAAVRFQTAGWPPDDRGVPRAGISSCA